MIKIEMQEHKPLRELVYEELRHLIMTGQLAPHTRMMEIELAESMGVSRTPVREAIRQLEKDNLVTIEPRKGAYVSDISPDDFDSMMLVREQLEGLATYLAAGKISGEGMTEVHEAAAACEKACEVNDLEELTRADTHFHYVITKCSENTYLIRLCQNLQEQALRFRYIYFKSGERASEIIKEHRRIVEALEQRNADKAREFLISHIKNLRKSIYSEEDFKSGTPAQEGINQPTGV